MTVSEAHKICRDYFNITNPSEEDSFVYTEALKYLIEETKDPRCMVELGGYYYELREFGLALKYYELAAEYDNLNAIIGLGYIWYYGRTGEKNYEKAFYYYNKARRMGDVVAAYKVADMYKNGYWVEKDYEKYKSIIEELYPKVKNARRLGEPLPEVFTRLAKIRSEEGNVEEALRLYDHARFFLAQRIRANPFFGNLTIMKWLIRDIYALRPFDPGNIRLYDLYYLLLSPVKVAFRFEEDEHEAEAAEEDGNVVIRFDDHWYRTVDDFFQNAELDGELMTARYEELYDFEVR
ncbi:MAG: sel1 repeat family protein [Clostridia bacterium]|nr:sel1 repeat family protein [Clostridia bacterium]